MSKSVSFKMAMVVVVFVALFGTVPIEAGHNVVPQQGLIEFLESEKRQGSITLSASPSASSFFSDGTTPDSIRAYRAEEWSTVGYLDLTSETRIPYNAVVTNVRVIYQSAPAGSFLVSRLYIFDENGRGDEVNRFSGRTSFHNGKSVRQQWAVQFWTEAIFAHPAMIWPRVTISYEY